MMIPVRGVFLIIIALFLFWLVGKEIKDLLTETPKTEIKAEDFTVESKPLPLEEARKELWAVYMGLENKWL